VNTLDISPTLIAAHAVAELSVVSAPTRPPSRKPNLT